MEDISPEDFIMEILLGHSGGGRLPDDVERQEMHCCVTCVMIM